MATVEPEVTFLNSAGEEVSNDPRWHARKTLESYGGKEVVDFDIPGPYDELEGAELKALTKERGIKTTGFRKASQFRDALEAWDDAQEEHDDDSDDSEGGDSSGDSDDEQE